MNKLLLIGLLLLASSCKSPPKTGNVQEGGLNMNEIYIDYQTKCNTFPYPTAIWVDQCFEFHCDIEKFAVWNNKCYEAKFAKEMMAENPLYFKQSREAYNE